MINVTEEVKYELLKAQTMSEFLQVIERYKTEFPGKFALTDFDDEICAWIEFLWKKPRSKGGSNTFQPDVLPNKKSN